MAHGSRGGGRGGRGGRWRDRFVPRPKGSFPGQRVRSPDGRYTLTERFVPRPEDIPEHIIKKRKENWQKHFPRINHWSLRIWNTLQDVFGRGTNRSVKWRMWRYVIQRCSARTHLVTHMRLTLLARACLGDAGPSAVRPRSIHTENYRKSYENHRKS